MTIFEMICPTRISLDFSFFWLGPNMENAQSAALESEPYVVIAHLPGFEDKNSLASQTCGGKILLLLIYI
jgi:hypothetical protein